MVIRTLHFTYTWRSGAAGACVDPGFLGVASLWRPRDVYCKFFFFEDGEDGKCTLNSNTRNHGCIINNSSSTYDGNYNSKQTHIQHQYSIFNTLHHPPKPQQPPQPIPPPASPSPPPALRKHPHIAKNTRSPTPPLYLSATATSPRGRASTVWRNATIYRRGG